MSIQSLGITGEGMNEGCNDDDDNDFDDLMRIIV